MKKHFIVLVQSTVLAASTVLYRVSKFINHCNVYHNSVLFCLRVVMLLCVTMLKKLENLPTVVKKERKPFLLMELCSRNLELFQEEQG